MCSGVWLWLGYPSIAGTTFKAEGVDLPSGSPPAPVGSGTVRVHTRVAAWDSADSGGTGSARPVMWAKIQPRTARARIAR